MSYHAFHGSSMQKKSTEGLLKKSELARLAQVSSSTINYYVSEGLIPVAYKPNQNMAWYHPSCVERIRLIKKLQREQYLPLPVIKRILSTTEISDEEIKLGLSISGLRRIEPGSDFCTKKELHEKTGYPLRKIDILTDQGILTPEKRGRKNLYSEFDVKLTEIVAEHDRSGLPFEYNIRVFKIYLEALKKAVRKDVKIFISMVIPAESSASKEIYFMDEMDDNLNKYIMLMRQKLTNQLTSRNMSELNHMPGRLASTYLFPLPVTAEMVPEEPGPLRFYRDLFIGDQAAAESAANLPIEREDKEALHILVELWNGKEAFLPEAKAESLLQVTTNSLAVITALGEYSGLIEPIQKVVGTVSRLVDFPVSIRRGNLIDLLAAYTRGTIIFLLPEIMELSGRGREALRQVTACTQDPEWMDPDWPGWLSRAVREALFPAINDNIQRILEL